MFTIKVDNAQIRQRLPLLVAAARNPRQVMLGIGREGGNLLKKHFREKDQTDINRLNPDRRQHFWLGVSRGVQPATVSSDAKTVTIPIVHPAIAQKVKGGTIVAKRARNLAIPVSPDAYGRTPATFEAETGRKLFVLRIGGTQANTRSSAILAAVAKDGRLQVEFTLTHSVTQSPDPTALPDLGPGSTFVATLLQRGQAILDRQLQQEGLT